MLKHYVFLCSVTCGMGIRMRTAECRYLNGTAADICLCTDSLGSPSAADKEEYSTGRDCSTECRDDDDYKKVFVHWSRVVTCVAWRTSDNNAVKHAELMPINCILIFVSNL